MGDSRVEKILEGDESVVPLSRVEKMLIQLKEEIAEAIEHGGDGGRPISKEEIDEIIDNIFHF